MIDGKSFLAIVPARGGSKGVPGKNIKLIAGRPLIAYTIDQIAAIPEIDCAVLSTEDTRIAAVAGGLNISVVDRPMELAQDDTRSEPVMLHALDVVEEQNGRGYDNIVLLEPTSPLRRPETILACMTLLIESGAPSVLTVKKTDAFIGSGEDGLFKPLFAHERGRRQDRPPRYEMSGTVFACTSGHLRETGELMCDTWPYLEVEGVETVDINTPADFELAEYHLDRRQHNG